MSDNGNGGGLVLPKKLTWGAVLILVGLVSSAATAQYRIGILESKADSAHRLERKICLLCTAIPGLGPNDKNCIRICTE